MRSLNSRVACEVKRSAGSQGRSRWQSAEMRRYCMASLPVHIVPSTLRRLAGVSTPIGAWGEAELCVVSPKPRGRYNEVLCILGGSKRPYHPAGVPIFERSSLNPLLFIKIGFAIAELAYLGMTCCIFIVQIEHDPILEPIEWRSDLPPKEPAPPSHQPPLD